MANYEETKKRVKEILSAAVLEQEPELHKRIRSFDTELLQMLREVGRDVMEELSDELASKQEKQHRTEGFTVEKRMDTPFLPSSDK